MRSLKDKRVLITGAAHGIGLAIAERFAGEGAAVLLTDVNADALPAAAEAVGRKGATPATYAVDVTDAAAIDEVRARIHSDIGPIDVLVNNAGVVFGGGFLDVPVERHVLTYRVNVEGTMLMARAFLPDLIRGTEGHLVNIASASGFIGLPYGSTYASSKWAVIGLSESLRLELEMQGHRHVGVTTVCPSYVGTGMFDGARPPLTTRMLTPKRLADKIVRAVLHDRIWIRTPWLVKLTPPLKGILPTRVFDVVARALGATTGMQHWKGHDA